METSRLLVILLSLLAVFSAASAAVGRRGAKVGGYAPIKNLNDPQVVEIAKYAVTEHNKEAGTKLEFVKIVKGESQVVAGMNYRLVISVKDAGAGDGNGNPRDYEAVVYERVWEHVRKLTSFKSV